MNHNDTMKELRSEYGEAIREARLYKGLRLIDVARAVGIERKNIGTLSNIERGKRWPGRKLARMLEELLGVKADMVPPYGSRYGQKELLSIHSKEKLSRMMQRAVDKSETEV